jgi:hypothetical protein
MARLRAAPDVRAADWVVEGLAEFGESVHSLVPVGFSAYVRIFHPAYMTHGDRLDPVRWSAIAAANGAHYHAGMQLTAITGSFDSYEGGQPGMFDAPPEIGTLPADLAERLAASLVRRTKSAETAWFAFWNGFGGIRHQIAFAPTFFAPHREYHLLAGPVEALSESGADPSYQSASLWWPDDRAWCVATEIDLNTTHRLRRIVPRRPSLPAGGRGAGDRSLDGNRLPQRSAESLRRANRDYPLASSKSPRLGWHSRSHCHARAGGGDVLCGSQTRTGGD